MMRHQMISCMYLLLVLSATFTMNQNESLT